MNKLLLSILILTSACMQSRKGIKSTQNEWLWGAVDFCDSPETECSDSDTHLVGTLHYDANYMEFEVIRSPSQNVDISYRILAKRPNESHWHRMRMQDAYSGKSLGYTEKMDLEPGAVFRVQPDVGFIETYTRWVVETEQTEGYKGAPVAADYGLGYRILDLNIKYNEADQDRPKI